MSFDEQAAAWIEWARSPLDAYWFYRDEFFDLLPPPCRTLEVGCGEGRVSRDLRRQGYDVVALDSSETLLAAARDADPAGEYVLGLAETLPFDAESFDLVVAYNSLMDVDEMPDAVAEIGRVLTPGGVLCACITHPMVDSGGWRDEATFVIDKPYLGRKRYEGTFERDGLPPFTFRGWVYPLESYSRALEGAGFVIEALREPAMPDALAEQRPGASPHRWQRMPNFVTFRASRRATPRP